MKELFKPKGKPLTPEQVEEIAQIKLSDLEKAVKDGSPRIKRFIDGN